jgi:hypothetical protein
MNFDAKLGQSFSLVVATCAILGAGGLTASPRVCAQEAAKSFLGFFGLQSNTDGESIDYHTRAPIVVPPRLDLPKPKEATADPSWPQDPDVAAERRAALDPHTPVAQVKANGESKTDSLPEEGPADECETNSGTRSTALCLSSSWKALKSVTDVFHHKTVQLGPEPVRKYLTEPPSGYRQPTGDGKVTDEETKNKPDPAAHDRPHMPGTSM